MNEKITKANYRYLKTLAKDLKVYNDEIAFAIKTETSYHAIHKVIMNEYDKKWGAKIITGHSAYADGHIPESVKFTA